jgi:predicted metalloprotease with PDZ domain
MKLQEPYVYTVRFPAPLTHYAEVEALIPTGSLDSLELFMAVWTPGSYLVREYARQVEKVAAFDETGGELPVRKMRKNRWSVVTKGCASVRVSYRVYCFELSVRTNWVDENFALLQGAATYLSVVGQLNRPHAIQIVLPAGWRAAFSGLPRDGEYFVAPDYDTLVDCPILAGNPSVYEFEVDGKPHYLVHEGDDSLWDGLRSLTDVAKIVRQQLSMWGSLPYERYVFLNILVDGNGRGGLEHKNSCCVIASRYSTRTRASYVSWLELISHEFFHTWNVKRLRPVELGPFDYENENYTRALWFSEGFTEYYGALMLVRAGITKPEEYLKGASMIEKLQTTPGRLTQSVELASFDAWIKLYRPDENTVNSAISYYVKGAVIAFLLDARLRAEGDSLDERMRRWFELHSGECGFSVIDEPWLTAAIETTEELDYAPALEFYGLRFKENASKKSWLGFTTKTDKGLLVITTVPRGTPAFEAGFSAEDEIVGINGYRVLPDQWAQRMEQFRPGEQITVLVSRRGKLQPVEATLAEEPRRGWILEIKPDATPEQTRRLNAWLGQPQQP